MESLATTPRLRIRRCTDADLPSILAVYRGCEDFLSLGPVPTASLRMVLEDLEHSRESGGFFCCILDAAGTTVGVVDIVPVVRPAAACLSLLMIAGPYRGHGYGTEVLQAIESYLMRHHGTDWFEGGVQVNNPAAIRFWRKVGFTIGTEAVSNPDGTVAYGMRKRLGPEQEVE